MRTYTRDEVEAVVRETAQRYERSADAHMRAGEKRGEAFERGRVEGCHEVLRRLDALPEPPLPPQPIHSARHDGTFVPPLPVTRCAACLEESGHRPGCPFGQRQSNPLHGAEVPAGTLVETFPGSPFVRLEPRPRAMTPPPEVPALKAESHYRCADPDCEAPEHPECGHVLTGRPPGSLRATCRKAPHGDDVPHRWDEEPGTMSPEPTAPEVVWTGDGVRVLADGTWEFWGQNIGIWLPATPGHEPQTDDLARALAEAKREAARRPTPTVLNLKGEERIEAWRKGGELMRKKVKDAIGARAGYIAPEDDRSLFARKLLHDIDKLLPTTDDRIPDSVDADLAAKALTKAVHNAVGMVADECLGMLHRGRVADAIATLTAAKQAAP